MTELATADYALTDADYDRLDLVMRGIVSVGADAAWVADRTGSMLAIADREPVATPGTTLARIGEAGVIRRSLTEVEVTVALTRPGFDLGSLAVWILAIDAVFVPHRRCALEATRVPRRWRR